MSIREISQVRYILPEQKRKPDHLKSNLRTILLTSRHLQTVKSYDKIKKLYRF